MAPRHFPLEYGLKALTIDLNYSPLSSKFCRPPPSSYSSACDVRDLVKFNATMDDPDPFDTLPLCTAARNCAWVCFKRGRLSQDLVNLSPLSADRPGAFRHRQIQSSANSCADFGLLVSESLHFKSTTSSCFTLLELTFTATSRLTWPYRAPRLTNSLYGERSVALVGRETLGSYGLVISNSVSLSSLRCFSPFPRNAYSLSVYG